MTIPFLWIAAALGLGIVLARALVLPPALWLGGALVALLLGLALFRRARLSAAWAAGLACWLCTGALAAALEPLALPANHVSRLAKAGVLPDDIALRWRGRLRSDPVRLPWGMRYEIALEEVEIEGQTRAISGGLRASYFRNSQPTEPEPLLRAGDRVEALTRARAPRNFLNPGAFDARTHLAREDVHLTASLRSTELLRKLGDTRPSFAQRLARLRGSMLGQLDRMFASQPEHAAVLRAMLLGDRSFIDHERAEQFQRTAAYHVLVISGMHVTVLALCIFWLGRRLRFPRWAVIVMTAAVLAAFLGVVEDKPPILRAALMAAVVLVATVLFRRAPLLNAIALSASLILMAQPSALADPSFQLSFLAAGMIGALGLPWIDRSSGPYRRALAHLTDPARDPAHAPGVAQFRLDLRDAIAWLAARWPGSRDKAVRASRVTLTGAASAAFRLWEVVVVSAAIQLGMLPIMALYFHRVSAGGVAANIPASLVSAAIVPAGFLTMALAALWDSAGDLAAALTGALASLLLASVEWFSGMEWSTWRVPDPPAWLLAAHMLGIIALAVWLRAKRRALAWITGGALAATSVLVSLHPFAPQLAHGRLEVTTLDVGQGDAIFAAFPGGQTLLIDGGGLFGAVRAGGFRTGLDIGEQVVSPYLWSRGIQRIDAVTLTHAHQDHLDGLQAVLENFSVNELWIAREVDSAACRTLLVTAARRGVRVVRKRRGHWFNWGDAGGLFLWPHAAESGSTPSAARNDDSIVLRLDYGRTSLLLAGDIEKDVEAELVALGDPLDTDFLKVPHHGSRTSATASFLAAITPRAAAISVSAFNPFGHPHADVLERLTVSGTRVLRTDRDGAVTFSSDGQIARIRSFVQSRQ